MNFLKIFALELLESVKQQGVVHKREFLLPRLFDWTLHRNVLLVDQRNQLFQDDELFELGHLFLLCHFDQVENLQQRVLIDRDLRSDLQRVQLGDVVYVWLDHLL